MEGEAKGMPTVLVERQTLWITAYM